MSELLQTAAGRRVAFALSLVLVALAGFSAGRFSAPAQVEERVEYRTEWRTRTVEVVKWKTARAVDTRTTTTPVLLPAPDGGVVLATTTTTETRERVTAAGSSDATTSSAGDSRGEATSKTTTQPQWRVGATVGASFTGEQPALPLAGPLVIGVQVERRIVGGVNAGVWVNSVGAGGVSVSLDF